MPNGDSKHPNNFIPDITPLEKQILKNRKAIKSFKAKADKSRTFAEKFADWMTVTFGSVEFLVLNVGWFVLWVMMNIGMFPGIVPFDPYPFGMLTTIVSLEAIVLAVFVLISQNRAAEVADLREEVNFQLGIISEQEITKMLSILKLIAEKNHIDLSKDALLEEMMQPTNMEKIERTLEKQISGVEMPLSLKIVTPKIAMPKLG